MSLYRGLWFATVAGMAGGLIAALLTALVQIPLGSGRPHLLPDTIAFFLFGIVVSVGIYLHFDR